MRFACWVVALVLITGLRVAAQVTVEFGLAQSQFLPGESIMAVVRISNQSGQALHLGEEEDWLTFSVDSKEGGAVSRNGHTPVQGAFDIESSQVAKKVVDLGPYFDLFKQGNYFAFATVKIPSWNKQVNSAPVNFSIIKANTFWEEDFGVYKSAGEGDGAPEVRKYALQQANYQKQLRLYARITDGGGNKLIKLVNLGAMVSFGKPEAQVDRTSRLHLLHQNGAKSFSYVVLDPDGKILVRQTHDYSNSRPRLRKDEQGRIFVMGGARRMMGSDIPQATMEPYPTNSPLPTPPSSEPPEKRQP